MSEGRFIGLHATKEMVYAKVLGNELPFTDSCVSIAREVYIDEQKNEEEKNMNIKGK
jgi:hypothetical protein